jgi:dihydropteroate synthase
VGWVRHRSPARRLRLIEPLGLLHGPGASEAIERRLALPLAGGPAAFSLARLMGDARGIVLANAIPPEFAEACARVCAPRPAFAGLPGRGPWVMGIVNVTPDSFSDGGRHFTLEAAVEAGLATRAAGADLVDIGGESTRPGSAPVTPEQEQARILPVIEALAREGVVVSVDTRHAATMRAALEAGARVVNDVTALAHDPLAAVVVAAACAPVVLMHMRGTPQTMMDHASYADVAAEVTAELAQRVAAAVAAGIAPGDIAVDPGIGFAKDHAQNIELLDRMAILHTLGCTVLAGVSRKRFIGHLTGEAVATQRGPGSLAAALAALDRGAAILRVHDVAETVQAVRVWRGLNGR